MTRRRRTQPLRGRGCESSPQLHDVGRWVVRGSWQGARGEHGSQESGGGERRSLPESSDSQALQPTSVVPSRT